MNAVDLPESAHLATPLGVSDSSCVFACPQCQAKDTALQPTPVGYLCRTCQTTYPIVRCDDLEIPWLFLDPKSAFVQWQDRYLRLMQEVDTEIRQLEMQSSEVQSTTTQRRLCHMRKAKRQFKKQIIDLLTPFNLATDKSHDIETRTARARLPQSQTLTSYMTNIFRDWAWGQAENESACGVLVSLMEGAGVERLGKLLTLGAGPGALTHLLEQRIPTSYSVKFDINPMFAAVNSAMMAKRTVTMMEFPIAPIDLAANAVQRKCKWTNLGGVEQSGPKTIYALGDIREAPFVEASFDTVLTPWLLDLFPEDLDMLLSTVNRLLPVGGTWLNTGSLNFMSAGAQFNLSPDELLERIGQYGFAVKSQDRSRLPYLQSPASAHHREEQVFSFCAFKTNDAVEPHRQTLRAGAATPVPDIETQYAASNYLLRAQVLCAVDGKRTVADIGSAVAKQYRLDPNEALRVVEGILNEEVRFQ